jgi:uncharacterized membrane protein
VIGGHRIRGPLRPLDVDTLIGHILGTGVVISGVLIVLGLIWSWGMTGQVTMAYAEPGVSLFQFAREDVHQAATGTFPPRLFLDAGLIVLVLTPYVRVAASILYFAVVARNPKPAAMSAFVLVVLTYALFLR